MATRISNAMSKVIDENDIEGMIALVKANPRLLTEETYLAGAGWLGYAASECSLDFLKAMIDIGFDVNLGGRDDVLAIVFAVLGDRFENVRFLYEAGSRLETETSLRNPLFSAIIKGNFEIAEFLVHKGIDLTVRYNSKTMKKMDALAFALMWGRMDIVNLIVQTLAVGNEKLAEKLIKKADKIAEKNVRI